MNPKTLFAVCFVAVIHAPTSRAERKVVVHNIPFNLTCSGRYTDGAAPVFIWKKNGVTLSNQDPYFKIYDPVTIIINETTKLSSTSRILNVVPLPRHSNTNVSCLVNKGNVNYFKSWTLIVERESPRIIIPPEGATFVDGMVSTLNCTSIYDVNITWSIGGKPFGEVVLLDSIADGGTVSVVSFIALRSQHHHELKCEIPSAVEGTNEPSPASKVVLAIAYPPFITSRGRISGNPNTFWCEVDANPAANISWVGPKDSQISLGIQHWTGINANSSITRSELKVDPVFATGAGGYTCIASNAYGNSSAMIPLGKNYLPVIVGLPVGMFFFAVVFIGLVVMVLMKWRPCEVVPPDPIYDSTMPEGSLGLTRRLSTFATGTWKRGSWFGSAEAQRSTADLEMLNRPRLSVPYLDK